MKFPSFRPLGTLLLLLPFVCAWADEVPPTPPLAEEASVPSHWRLAVSPYTAHLHYNPEHQYVWAIGMERQRDDRWLAGGSFFSNSFGQPSGYVYLGQRYDWLLGNPQLFWQWSAGILYGYVGEYKDKVPLNYNGFSPGALLSLGWQFNRQLSTQINTLGDAGFMLQLSYDFH
jgi:hypothetical protein